MQKGFIKIGALVSVIVLAFIAGFLLFTHPSVKNALATQQVEENDGCDHGCPIVNFQWKHYLDCPEGYKVNHDNETKCEKKNDPNKGQLIDRPYENKSADVQYEKSEDPGKCHRPSDHDLDTVYGMDKDAVHDFKDANGEWMDSVDIVPDGYYHEEGACYPKTPVCNDASATNYGGEDGQFDSNKEIANNELCKYPEVTPVPTNTPSNGGSQGGDGLSDGRSDGRSSSPQGQVLGASTMAGTGTFEQNLMNTFAIFGMLLLTAGYKSYAKEKVQI